MNIDSKCPKCKSDNVHDLDTEHQAKQVVVSFWCRDCKTEYFEVFVRDDTQTEIVTD